MQITNDAGKIVTREVIGNGPYSEHLTGEKSAYVMPVLPFNGIDYARPNDSLDSITHLPHYYSGPGLAYGYDMVDGGPQAFATDSVLSVQFVGGLEYWNGSAFQDAGATQLKAFRGSDPAITDPPQNFAVTSDTGPYDDLALSAVTAGYGDEGAEVHGTVRFALLGDGVSLTSDSPDGVYRVGLQIESTQSDLLPSEPYYFILDKDAPDETVQAAVNSLGYEASHIQYVPEPTTLLPVAFAMFATAQLRRVRQDRMRG